MGMDVLGKCPTCEVGQYFRNNVWSWRPLWDYCLEVSSDARQVKSGHTNDGDGLDRRGARALALTLATKIADGHTRTYAIAYKATNDALPDETCVLCEGTGSRKAPPDIGAGDAGYCNACADTGKRRPSATMYPFSEENVMEFAIFLEASGGFEIW